MPKKKLEILEFKTEVEEAEFWETHSPFDYNLKLEKVKVKAPKDRPITIRLDSQSRQKLEQLAMAYGMGPSTFARRLIDAAIRQLTQKHQKSLTVEEAIGLIETLTPRDLEAQARLFQEQNPALVDALGRSPEAAESLVKETFAFLLRVGGLLKTAGFSLEPPLSQSRKKSMGQKAT